MLSNLDSLMYVLPEAILTATIAVLVVMSFFTVGREKMPGLLFSNTALIGVVLSLIATVWVSSLGPATLFMGMVSFDRLGIFFKFVFGVAALIAIIMSQKSRDLQGADAVSYYMLIVILTLGMNFLAMAANLLMIYLSLETVSISSYLLTGYVGHVRRSSEAALKYVIYGGVASGIMVYGFSLLYGLTGTLQLAGIADFLRFNPTNRLVLFLALILSLAGFGFKVAAFPFHMWSPDVYEGAPTPFTAFLSVGPKAAGFAVLIRFLLTAMLHPAGDHFIDIKSIGIAEIISLLAIATMTVGNLVALVQVNLKRMLAYSSVAHAGYMLMGLAALNQEAVNAVMLYLVVYGIMNLGAFLVVIMVANQFGVEDLDGYKGLGLRGGSGAVVAVAMSIFLFSLTGIPPMAGFVGKFYLFGAVIRSGLYWLALIGALNSVIALFYYVRVIKVMFFDAPADEAGFARPGLRYGTVLGVLSILTIYLGIFWQPLATWVQASAKVLY